MTSQFHRAVQKKNQLTDSDEKEEKPKKYPDQNNSNELYFEQQAADESGAPELFEESSETNEGRYSKLPASLATKPSQYQRSSKLRPTNVQIVEKDMSLDAVDQSLASQPSGEVKVVSGTYSPFTASAQLIIANDESKTVQSEDVQPDSKRTAKKLQKQNIGDQEKKIAKNIDKMQIEVERQLNTQTFNPRDNSGAQETQRKLITEDNGDEVQSVRSVAVVSAFTYACAYPNCIVAQNYELRNVIKIKQRINRMEQQAKKELEQRLKVSYGEEQKKVSVIESVAQSTPTQGGGQRQRRAYDLNSDSTFMQEKVEPCECGLRYHRICIREKIVKGMLKQCPECQAGYSVGFSDCYALYNKARPNYLAYMLVQEILLFLSIIVFSEVTRWSAIYTWNTNNPSMLLQWYIILQTLTTAATGLALVTFFIRLKGVYCVRELEDIIVFDKSQQTTLDFDSPAILTVFFQDITTYETQTKYYKKSVTDRYLDRAAGLLGTPLQRVRSLISKIND